MEMKFSKSYFIIIALCVFLSRPTHEVDLKFSLPSFIQPIKYKLELLIDVQHQWPNLEEKVSLTVKCVEEETDNIFVNVKRSHLIIKEEKVRVKLSESNPEFLIGIRNHVHDEENDIHIIQLSTPLEVNKVYEVLIPFEKSGSLRPKGYYVDEHEDASKNGSEYIVTQLGPADARGIFPCLDQIQFKTEFKVFLKRPENFRGFSNMRRINSKEVPNIPDLVEDEFEESLPMSTNNFAIALIDSKMFQELDVSDDKRIQLYATETILSKMEVAFSVSWLAMNFFSQFFESPYALLKLNMIVLPNFNDKDKPKHGILTLPDSSISSPENSETNIALYTCHAVSHQWLGTHVTVSSWNIYWLLEALAHLLEKPCLESIYPEQRLSYFDTRLVKTVTILLPYEMQATPYTMLDFDYFDTLDTYNLEDAIVAKAFCLFQMLNFSFGDELFRKFLASYMQTPNSTGSSLEYVGDIFTKTVNDSQTFLYHIDVNEYMRSWISKRGFPLLTVIRSKNGKSVRITQKNFRLYFDPDEALISDNSCWKMPLRFTTNKDEAPDNNKIHHWMDCAKPFSTTINADKNDWMIVDLRWNVLCRVHYDNDNWNAIQSVLMNPEQHSRINTLSRVQLISDMFAFSDAGILSYERVLDTMKFLVHEDSFLPISAAITELYRIRDRLMGSEILFPLFQEYGRKILQVKFEKQGAEGNTDSSQTNREKYLYERLIIKSSCIFGVQECQLLGKALFDKWHSSGQEKEEVDDDRIAYYCEAMKLANIMEWKFLWKQYDIQRGSTFNTHILMALGCSSDERILSYYLNWSIGKRQIDHKISPEDSPKAFTSVSMNENGYPVMKKFILENFEIIETFLRGSSVSVDFYVKKLLDITTQTEDLNDLRAIITKNYANANDFETNLRGAERNIWWRGKYDEKLKLYFEKQNLPSELEQKM